MRPELSFVAYCVALLWNINQRMSCILYRTHTQLNYTFYIMLIISAVALGQKNKVIFEIEMKCVKVFVYTVQPHWQLQNLNWNYLFVSSVCIKEALEKRGFEDIVSSDQTFNCVIKQKKRIKICVHQNTVFRFQNKNRTSKHPIFFWKLYPCYKAVRFYG